MNMNGYHRPEPFVSMIITYTFTIKFACLSPVYTTQGFLDKVRYRLFFSVVPSSHSFSPPLSYHSTQSFFPSLFLLLTSSLPTHTPPRLHITHCILFYQIKSTMSVFRSRGVFSLVLVVVLVVFLSSQVLTSLPSHSLPFHSLTYHPPFHPHSPLNPLSPTPLSPPILTPHPHPPLDRIATIPSPP